MITNLGSTLTKPDVYITYRLKIVAYEISEGQATLKKNN